MSLTFGQSLISQHIPSKYRPSGPYTKSSFQTAMTRFAKEDPEEYSKAIQKVKVEGDRVATLEGISVGLDDIEPNYSERDPVLKNAMKQLQKTTDDAQRRKIISETQATLLDQAKNHQGTMGMMVRSGARGNAGQLMKAVVAPVGATDENDDVQPWLINKSYAEGLDHASWFATNKEARQNAIKSVTSVSEPGDLGKILVNNMQGVVVTEPDCGTNNGIPLPVSDPEIMDRYVAQTKGPATRGTLITAGVKRKLNAMYKPNDTIMVRSPMTCEAEDGVCQKCMGMDSRGRTMDVGTNVGLRAATSLSEPLVQMQLSSKHATATAGGEKNPLSGTSGFRMLIESPKNFPGQAVLAPEDGRVSSVRAAPQGGWYITIDSGKPIHTKQEPVVKVGDTVEMGEALTKGVPRPADIVEKRGLGAGRDYLVSSLQTLYQGSKQNIDRRHLETLAKTNLNYVKIDNIDDDLSEEHGLVRGDIVDYNKLHRLTGDKSTEVSVDQAVGKTLGKGVGIHSAGTVIRPSMVAQWKREGRKTVPVADKGLSVTPLMSPATRNPLLNPDWAVRLGHRYLQQSLLEGAHQGQQTNIHSTNPIPALLFSTEFGEGSRGKY